MRRDSGGVLPIQHQVESFTRKHGYFNATGDDAARCRYRKILILLTPAKEEIPSDLTSVAVISFNVKRQTGCSVSIETVDLIRIVVNCININTVHRAYKYYAGRDAS